MLPTRTIPVDLSAFPKHYLPWHLSSPLVHEGLAYLVNNAGVLTVIDLATDKPVYQKLLDLDVFQDHNEGAARGVGSSPILAGKQIYILGCSGTAHGHRSGAASSGNAQRTESKTLPCSASGPSGRSVSSPIRLPTAVDLYIRGEDRLYAIGPP